MIFMDTDIFVVDTLLPGDKRYKTNKLFLNETENKATSIFSLFELIGIASFNLNEVEPIKLFTGFGEAYSLKVLYPSSYISVNEFIEDLFERIFEKITLKMCFQDALILTLAEEHNCSSFIT